MQILVSNDDGYLAEGIRKLNLALATLARTTIVAPDRNRSGASNSLTLDVPLRVFEAEPGVHYVSGGTPTDCVHIAISGYFNSEFDLVCSGINDGANLGDDTLYSGTVAAAIEGRFLGLPTMAFSLCMEPGSGRHFDTAAQGRQTRWSGGCSNSRWNGASRSTSTYRTCRSTSCAASRPRAWVGGIAPSPSFRSTIRKGRRMYWIGPSGDGQDAGEGTDFDAIASGYVSVTPLQTDLTRHRHAADHCAMAASPGMSATNNHAGIGMTSARTRDRLVQSLREQGIVDARVLERIRNLPRHIFVDEALSSRAYENTALPIGWGQTISQPYIVARMTEALLAGGALGKVLEIGFGCGYQTAMLLPFVETVYASSESSRWWSAPSRA